MRVDALGTLDTACGQAAAGGRTGTSPDRYPMTEIWGPALQPAVLQPCCNRPALIAHSAIDTCRAYQRAALLRSINVNEHSRKACTGTYENWLQSCADDSTEAIASCLHAHQHHIWPPVLYGWATALLLFDMNAMHHHIPQAFAAHQVMMKQGGE